MSDEYRRIPEYDLGRLRARRRKFLDNTLDFVGLTLEGVVFDALVRKTKRLFQIKDERVIRETLLPYVGQDFATLTRDQLALTVVGGYATMRSGEPIRPFYGLAEPEWAPVEIDEVCYGHVHKGRTFANMTVLVMAGTAVGQMLRKQLPMRFVTTGLARRLAWPLRDPRPVHNELVGMSFMAQLVQDDRQRLDIKEFICVPHQVKYNRKIRQRRQEPCVRHYRQRCHTCPVGHTSCCRGTHRHTWVFKPCKVCKREKAPFDPWKSRATVCISCSTKTARAHWSRERKGMA
jgi:hypothetical protein